MANASKNLIVVRMKLQLEKYVNVLFHMLELMENARNVQFIHLLLKIIQNAFVIIPTNGIIKLLDAKG